MKKIILMSVLLGFVVTTNGFAKNAGKYDRNSVEFNRILQEEEKKQLEIDKELAEEQKKEEKQLTGLALKIADKEKYDYWIVRPQARSLFMAIEKNVLIGEMNKARKLLDELGSFVDMPGSDMAELALYNVAKSIVYREIGEEEKSKISCLRAIRITHKPELYKTQKINAELTDIFCSKYLPEVEKSETRLEQRRRGSYTYVLSHLKEEKFINHVKYLKIMDTVYFFPTSDKNVFFTLFKSNKSKLVTMYGIQSIEKARYLLNAAVEIMRKWQEREETLFILKTGYKMTVKLLRQKYEKNPNNNLLVGKFLMAIANNYYGSISYKQSIPYYEKAAEIFKKNGFDYFLVEALQNLSYVYRLARNVDKALKTVMVTLNEAARVYGKDSTEYASILIIEADIYNIDKDYSNAIRDLKEARKIFAEKYGEYSNKVKLIDLNIKYVELDEEASF